MTECTSPVCKYPNCCCHFIGHYPPYSPQIVSVPADSQSVYCSPGTCGNGKCIAFGKCIEQLPEVESPSISPAPSYPNTGLLNSNTVSDAQTAWVNEQLKSLAPRPTHCPHRLKEAGQPFSTWCNTCGGLMRCPHIKSAPPRRIIGFTGLMGSGKSEAARRLIAQHGFWQGKFARALKDMLRTFLRYRGASSELIDRMIEGDLKEAPSRYLNGRTPRHAMQTLGTEWGRDCIHNDIWVDTEMEAQAKEKALVFDDVRFANEAGAIRAAGGIIVKVQRPSAITRSEHLSELMPFAVDCTLVNNESIDEWHATVDELVRDLSWVQA